jgi:hypothetical protein
MTRSSNTLLVEAQCSITSSEKRVAISPSAMATMRPSKGSAGLEFIVGKLAFFRCIMLEFKVLRGDAGRCMR